MDKEINTFTVGGKKCYHHNGTYRCVEFKIWIFKFKKRVFVCSDCVDVLSLDRFREESYRSKFEHPMDSKKPKEKLYTKDQVIAYAKVKCKEQRAICGHASNGKFMIEINNAPEPNFK